MAENKNVFRGHGAGAGGGAAAGGAGKERAGDDTRPSATCFVSLNILL